ncbi:thiamine pyrophosphate-binding protein [Nocardioides humi]|uniref:Thiamine pyrophosphate-binding protein n=1 Tax=Nocardioides humi TaxID=449461 RepID=A0ABN2B5B9_9ACTN|nr:thiamine pyrophosphate-binding protein [Nocardioides humi]
MRVCERIADVLAQDGVDTVFAVPGDANLFVVDVMSRVRAVRVVTAGHEAGAVTMADGYGRVRGEVGVASVTHGPGLTNTITALVEAVRNRSSLLLLVGDTSVTRPFHLQNIDQRELVKATGARFREIRSAATAADDTRRALHEAASGRGPVVLNYSADLVHEQVPADREVPPPPCLPGGAPRLDVLRQGADENALDEALGIMASARRPVILAGRGAVGSGARAELLALAEQLGAPLATTLMAKDWFRGEAADIGVCGTLATPQAGELIGQADCLVAFGASLNPLTTASGDLVRGTTLIHCDADAAAFARFTDAQVRVHGDVRTVARAMLSSLAGMEPTSTYRSRVAAVAQTVPDVRSGLDPVEATDFLDAALPAERTLVLDAGRYMGIPMRRFHVSDPGDFVFTCNFGSIGLGTGAAVGAALARPDRPTVLCVGDGGFVMGGLAEFNSAVRHGADLVVVLYNDAAYGAEYIQLERAGLPTALSEFAWPDMAALATSLGGQGIGVDGPDDLPRALEAINQRTGPVLVDLRLDPTQIPPIH